MNMQTWRRGMILAMLWALSWGGCSPSLSAAAARVVSTEHIAINITFHGADDMRPFAQRALAVAARWYPKLCAMLPSPGFTPPTHVLIVISPKLKGIAYTTGTTVHLGANYFKNHPDDMGVVVHELTHVVQQYHHPEPSWLVEGIADYMRFYFYEPPARRPHINPAGRHYTDGYQMTAEFLHFAQRYNHGLVRHLNVKLRAGTYHRTLFKQLTGHSLKALWMLFNRHWHHSHAAASTAKP